MKRAHELALVKLRQLNGAHIGVSDAACPLCGPDCRSPTNRNRRVLRIWDDGKFVTYKCARCDAHGWANDDGVADMAPPLKHDDRSSVESRIELARFLWGQSKPLGFLAETYLRSRRCLIDGGNLRFLPRKGDHAPAMVARFGTGTLTGIHLTRLRDDGTKAGMEADKIMIGPSVGQPIVIADNPDRGELIIAEGIEDTASLALATGWTAWAAGSASRIASLVAATAPYERVFLAVDHDRAGMVALAQSRKMRCDLVPIDIAKILSIKDHCDANEALTRFGIDALRAAVEWADAQARYISRDIGFHAMQRSIERAEGVFKTMLDLRS